MGNRMNANGNRWHNMSHPYMAFEREPIFLLIHLDFFFFSFTNNPSKRMRGGQMIHSEREDWEYIHISVTVKHIYRNIFVGFDFVFFHFIFFFFIIFLSISLLVVSRREINPRYNLESDAWSVICTNCKCSRKRIWHCVSTFIHHVYT